MWTIYRVRWRVWLSLSLALLLGCSSHCWSRYRQAPGADDLGLALYHRPDVL